MLVQTAYAVQNAALQLSPVTKYGSVPALTDALTGLFSPIGALVTVDASAGLVSILATTPADSTAFFTPAILSDVASAAVVAGFEGGFGPAVLGTGCGFTNKVPTVAGPNETFPGVLDCPDSLSVTLKTEGSPPIEAINAAFCKALDYSSCALISTTLDGDASTTVIRTKDPVFTLTVIKSALLSPSYLTMLRASEATVYSTLVFVRQSVEIEMRSGSLSSCADKLWYLTFLILLAPIMYVASRYLYKCGASRGRKKAEAEQNLTRMAGKGQLTFSTLAQMQQQEYAQRVAQAMQSQ